MNNKKIVRFQQVFKSGRHVESTIKMKKLHPQIMMTKDCIILMKSKHMHMKQMLEGSVKMDY